MILNINTTPVPKGRPKFGRGKTYTPEKTREFESTVRSAWVKAYPDCMPLTGAVSVSMVFSLPLLKSFNKANKQKAIDGTLRPAKRPDIDNYVKAVLDALNGLAFTDDGQVVELKAAKWYGTEPGIMVEIKGVGESVHKRS